MTEMVIRIDPEKCQLSGECIKICPQQAISIKDGNAVIDQSRCDLDGMCIPACPRDAISMIETG